MFIPFATQLFSTLVTSSNLRNQAPLFTELRLLQATAELTRTILFHRKIFHKTSPKTACILIKLAQKNATRNSNKNPTTQRKKQPDCAGKPCN